MQQYIVRSGQNIYDVSVMLYGTVEGVFDLLVSNPWLSMDITLKAGDILNYHDEYVINQSVTNWLNTNNILVRNGEHCYNNGDILDVVNRHYQDEHPETLQTLLDCSPDEVSMFWELLTVPRILIDQQGLYSQISTSQKQGTHMFIDWGDYSDIEVIEGERLVQLDHCYRSAASHTITIYGDFVCDILDFTKLSGTYYFLDSIHVSEFLTSIDNPHLNALIIID